MKKSTMGIGAGVAVAALAAAVATFAVPAFSPESDLSRSLGNPDKRWAGVYTPYISDGETIAEVSNIRLKDEVLDHEQLANRDAPDQHPVSAIVGLTEILQPATMVSDGLMVASDKAKLDNFSTEGIVRYTAHGDIRLGAGVKLLGVDARDADHNLIMLSDRGVVDIGSPAIPANISSSIRPTVQLSEGSIESVAFLSDVQPHTLWEIDSPEELATLTNAILGDIARVVEEDDAAGDAYQLIADDPAEIDSWLNITRDDDVVSVNGKSGAVLLGLADFPDVQDAIDAYAHLIGDVSDLQTAVGGKAPISHMHPTSQVTGLDTALAGKAATTTTIATTAPLAGGGNLTTNRTLSIADATTTAKGAVQLSDAVNSASTTLAATANAVKKTYDLAATKADATALSGYVTTAALTSGLAGKANTAHAHAIADVTNLQATLNAKAALASPAFTGTPTAPTAAVSTNNTQIATTGFVKAVVASSEVDLSDYTTTAAMTTALAGKANTAHTHAQADISGLATSLAGKADTNHSHTTAQVTGLDTALAAKAGTAVATTSANGLMSATDKSKLDGVAAGAQVNTVASVAGKTGAVTLSSSDVGLGSVNNTSDANKPISTATQTALNAKANLASPAFTGNPTVPTQATTDNSTRAANTAYVKAAIASDAGASGFTTKVVITSSGTWVAPVGKKIKVICIGGGGGGGGTARRGGLAGGSTSFGGQITALGGSGGGGGGLGDRAIGGGGGGGAGFVTTEYISVTKDTSYAVTIGAGGSVSSTAGTSPTGTLPGRQTSAATVSYISGGGGGGGGNGGTGDGGSSGFYGGSGGSGGTNGTGYGGGGGGAGGNSSSYSGGMGGSASDGGAFGSDGTLTTSGAVLGGAGGPGAVIIEY